MTPGRLLLILFLVIPLLEIYLLIKVGSVIGALPTVLLTVFTAITGAAMVRYQGLGALARAQQALLSGRAPGLPVFDGACLLVAGALLLTPGFFTDAIGFALLVPGVRRRLFDLLIRRLPSGPVGPGPGAGGFTPDAEPPRNVIEGEYTRKS